MKIISLTGRLFAWDDDDDAIPDDRHGGVQKHKRDGTRIVPDWYGFLTGPAFGLVGYG